MKTVSVAKFRLGGKDFAVVPWSEYQRLTGKRSRLARPARRSAEDAGDVAELKRRATEVTKPYSELRRKLGLA
jgi:hypothetical protein